MDFASYLGRGECALIPIARLYYATVRRAVAAGSHQIDGSTIRNLAQIGDASGMDDRRADIVDQLFLKDRATTADRVEYLAQRGRGVLTDLPSRASLIRVRR